jgi:hypothetical protein
MQLSKIFISDMEINAPDEVEGNTDTPEAEVLLQTTVVYFVRRNVAVLARKPNTFTFSSIK